MTITLATYFLLPMTGLPTTAAAETWFRVNNPGSWLDMYTDPGHRQGKLQCRIPHGDYVKHAGLTQRNQNGKTYYWVRWMRKLGVMEWHWRDAMNNSWCPFGNETVGWKAI